MNQKDVVSLSYPVIPLNSNDIGLITDVISSEIITNACITSCGHSFDKNTLDQWLTRSTACPLCNTKLTSLEIFIDAPLNALIAEIKAQEILDQDTVLLKLNDKVINVFIDPNSKNLISDPVLTICCNKLYNKSSISTEKCCKESKKTINHFNLKTLLEDFQSTGLKDIFSQLKTEFLNAIIQNNFTLIKEYLEKFPLLVQVALNDNENVLGKAISDFFHKFGSKKLAAYINQFEKIFGEQFVSICAIVIRELGFVLLDKDQKFLQELIKKAPHLVDIEYTGVDTVYNGYTLLHKATWTKKLDMMEFLLQQGANVNKGYTVVKKGTTALHLASEINSVPALDLLMRWGANVNASAELNYTPIFVAINHNSIDAVNYLLTIKDLNLSEYHKELTPLQFAIYIEHYEIAKILLKQNIDINQKSLEGDTALHLIVASREKQLVELFLKQPLIDIDIKNKSGKIAENLARNSPEIFALFTDPFLLYAKARRHLLLKEPDKAVAPLIKLYKDFGPPILLSHLEILEAEYKDYYQTICENILEKIYHEIAEHNEVPLFLKLISSAKNVLLELANLLYAQQKFAFLAIVLVVMEEIQDKDLFQKLAPQKNKLCQEFLKQLTILKEKNEDVAFNFINDTIQNKNALGKVVGKKLFFDWGASDKVRQSLIDYIEKYFAKDLRLFTLKV